MVGCSTRRLHKLSWLGNLAFSDNGYRNVYNIGDWMKFLD
jgi:hypothetical protein